MEILEGFLILVIKVFYSIVFLVGILSLIDSGIFTKEGMEDQEMLGTFSVASMGCSFMLMASYIFFNLMVLLILGIALFLYGAILHFVCSACSEDVKY